MTTGTEILATEEIPSEDEAAEVIRQRPWLTPLIGCVVLLAILVSGPIYGRLASGGKVDPLVDRDAASVDITVDLPFEPESYHRETLSTLGVFAGRDRTDPTKMRLRAVTQDNLDKIANLYWVEGIAPT